MQQNDIYRAEVERLMLANGGSITREQIVTAATDPRSPLHNYFEWDNDAAAHKFRLHQAGMLLRTITVNLVHAPAEERTFTGTTVVHAPEGKPIRAFQSTRQVRMAGGGYVPISTVVNDDERFEDMIDTLQTEVDALALRVIQIRDAAREVGRQDDRLDALVVRLTGASPPSAPPAADGDEAAPPPAA